MNKIALFVGRSGSGKTTIAQYLNDTIGLTQIDSYTTRPQRYPGEPGHIYVSDAEFDKLTDMVAYTDFNGHRYCATTQQVEENDIYVIDVAGVEYFKEHYHGSKAVYVFYFSVPNDELQKRMIDRGDGILGSMLRIENDAIMFADAENRLRALYNNVWVIENNDVATAAAEILQLLKEE